MGVAERRERERQERRDCILDAAESVFLDRGLSAATMEEIAKQAEVSKGTLYLYFQGKDELYLTVANRALSEMLERLTVAASGEGDGLSRIRAMMDAHAGFAGDSQSRFRVAITWLTSGYSVADSSAEFAEYRSLVGRIFRTAVDTIALGQKDGSIRADMDPRVLSTQIWGAMLGVLMVRQSDSELSRRMPEPIEMNALVPGFIELWIDALRGPRAVKSGIRIATGTEHS